MSINVKVLSNSDILKFCQLLYVFCQLLYVLTIIFAVAIIGHVCAYMKIITIYPLLKKNDTWQKTTVCWL